MKNTVKITAFIMLVLLTLITAGSCGGKSAEEANQTGVNIPEAVNAGNNGESGGGQPADDKLVYDDVPELDFGGYEYRVLFGDFGERSGVHFYPETEEGEVLNDSVYRRNLKVQERFNVEFKATTVAGGGSGTLTKSVNAGSDDYDMIMVVDREAHTASERNLLYPINKLEYVDLSKPYWMQEVNRLISVGNKLDYAFSDEVLSVFENTIVVYFNKKMAQDLGLEDFYSLVRTGEWTFDRFFESARAGIKNVSGSEKMTDDDYWGIIADPGLFYSFWINAGINTVEKDENDIPYFNLPGNERFFNVCQKGFDNLTVEGIYNANSSSAASNTFFRNGRALFNVGLIMEMIDLRDMPDDFGALPFPKYDSVQERYYTRLGGGRPFVIPATNQRPDIAGAVMESMACETRNTVFPAYYESSLKNKFSRDLDTVEMLDLIRETSTWDFGCITWGQQIGGPLVDIFAKKTNTIASWVEKNQEKIETLIQKSVDAILNAE